MIPFFAGKAHHFLRARREFLLPRSSVFQCIQNSIDAFEGVSLDECEIAAVCLDHLRGPDRADRIQIAKFLADDLNRFNRDQVTQQGLDLGRELLDASRLMQGAAPSRRQ